MKRYFASLSALALIACAAPVPAQTIAVPNSMNFQGRLAKPDGTPLADGTYAVLFSLYDALAGGALKWSQTKAVTVRNGTIAATLDAFPASAFNGSLWLEIKIGTNPALTPRQPLVSVAYAMKAGSVPDGSIANNSLAGGITADKFASGIFNPLAWLLGGNSGVTSGFIGTTDNNPLVFKVNGHQAARYTYATNGAFQSMNMLGGSEINSIGAGVTGATIAGGGQDYLTGADYPNSVTADFGTIGGGVSNLVSNYFGTLSGGASNTVSGYVGTVSGGDFNTASGEHSNIGGGNSNMASFPFAVVGGGQLNTAGYYYAAVGGGYGNMASGDRSTVSGGLFNAASADRASVAGGGNNTASKDYATVGGGIHNTASGDSATVAGGGSSAASGEEATVGGGFSNTASNFYGTVGGGAGNTASGFAATVEGGFNNTAAGYYSFASGQQAQANHDGSFVWNDASDTNAQRFFASTGNNQFLVHASGGVGINTNNPGGALFAVHGSLADATFLIGGAGVDAHHLSSGRDFVFNSVAGMYSFRKVTSLSTLATSNMDQFRINADGSALLRGSLTQNSDVRLKKNIATLENPLDSLLNLRGVSYEWKDADREPGTQVGFIAQEVERIFPELVRTDANGYKSVNYIGVVPVAVEAIKTLNAKVDAQQKQIDDKQRQIDELKAQLNGLDALKKQVAALVRQMQDAKKP